MSGGRGGSPTFEEVDFAATPLGELVLRRRRPPSMPDIDVFEVTLAGRFLMSSLVTASEEALARRALDRLLAAARPEDRFEVFVGGLGLGHTAVALLDEPRVAHVEVAELLPEVVTWHERGLVPLASRITGDPRVAIVVADGFARLTGVECRGRFDAVLIDVDDAPDDLLDAGHAWFWAEPGRVAAALRPGGVLGVWTARPPDDALADRIAAAFDDVAVEPVEFRNPLLDRDDVNAIYFGRARGGAEPAT